jgi:hypothetical protein
MQVTNGITIAPCPLSREKRRPQAHAMPGGDRASGITHGGYIAARV